MTMKNNLLISELLNKQLQNVPNDKKLQYGDIKRMSKYISGNIFDETVCSNYLGYITNASDPEKGVYINFYFKGKKAILHRLLYANFVDTLGDDEYLKFTCPNKGKCCNIHHLKKFKYLKKNKDDDKEKTNITKKKIEKKIITHNFTLNFD
jgi:hypothetical protein